MWFLKYSFLRKDEGMKEQVPSNFFTTPYSKEEFEFISKYITDSRKYTDFPIPNFLKLPEEYTSLLKYSKSGIITNGEREFDFFDIKTIREFYLNYGFIIYDPNMLPIAFNGGGTFYIYNFTKNIENPPIYAVHSSCIGGNDFTCFLGNTLDEVLNKTIDIDYEIDQQKPQIELSDIQKEKNRINKKKIELNSQLEKMKEKKNNNEIDLKTFLKYKREITQKINEL